MNAVTAYRNVHRSGLVEGASPHALILMLLDAGLARIAAARALDARERRAERHRCLDRALAIVQELQGVLHDPENDALAGQLFALYAHVIDRLLVADRSGEDGPLADAAAVLGTLREGWAGIAPQERVAA